ncbi:MAG: M23 family metallopeptidase [Gammaproteobacteria bacterium]|nr:M23 family metallopeptidase [Gammaproteobacteria bacterium]
MHVIYFDRYDRRYTLKVSKVLRYLLIFILTTILILAFFSGYMLGKHKNLDQGSQKQWVKSWHSELENQKKLIDITRNETQIHLDAFTEQVAKLQAHVARLDALGIHLSKLAKIDEELFNFSNKLSEQDLHATDSETNPESGSEQDAGEPSKDSIDFFKSFEELSSSIYTLDNQLNLLQTVLKHQKLDNETLVKGKPIARGYISSYFGYRNHPIKKHRILHKGIDFVGRPGTPILAVASGVVSYATGRGGYGQLIEINHGDGYFTRYAHNSKLLVRVGDLVNKGDVIAEMGSTGLSTGTHVHFEVWRNGHPENPITYLTKK